MFSNVPKDFLTKMYVGVGPWGGPYSKPCYCGVEFEEDDVVCVIKYPDGDLMCCHEECYERLSGNAGFQG